MASTRQEAEPKSSQWDRHRKSQIVLIRISSKPAIYQLQTLVKEPHTSRLKEAQLLETAISESISISMSAPILISMSISPLQEPFKGNPGVYLGSSPRGHTELISVLSQRHFKSHVLSTRSVKLEPSADSSPPLR